MNNIQLVCFDLDDTLWPCMPTIIKAEQTLYQWLQTHKAEITAAYSMEQLRSKRIQLADQQPELRHNLTALRKASLKLLAIEFGYDEQWINIAFDVFYQARQQVELFDDVEPVLDKLAKVVKLGAMTNGNADIYQTSIGHLFDYSISAEQVGAAKPDIAMFKTLIEQASVPKDQILFIGDHQQQDIAGALACGIPNIWLNRQDLRWSIDGIEPDYTVRSLHEILPFLGLD